MGCHHPCVYIFDGYVYKCIHGRHRYLREWLWIVATHVPILVMDMYIQAYMVEINIRESGCGMSPPMCVNVCYEYVYKCTHG